MVAVLITLSVRREWIDRHVATSDLFDVWLVVTVGSLL
jgi:hypothetical protein